MGVGGQRYIPAALPPGRLGTHYVGGWVGPKAGWTGEENLSHTGIRPPGRLARSKSLYRLSSPGPNALCFTCKTLQNWCSFGFVYTRFNIKKFYVLSTQCIYMFCMHVRTNSDHFCMQY